MASRRETPAWKSVRSLHPDLLNSLGHSHPLEGLPTGRGRSAGQRGDPLRWPRTFEPQASPQPGHPEPPPALGPPSHPGLPWENIFLLIGIFGGGRGLAKFIPQTHDSKGNSYPPILPTLTRERAQPSQTSPGKNACRSPKNHASRVNREVQTVRNPTGRRARCSALSILLLISFAQQSWGHAHPQRRKRRSQR